MCCHHINKTLSRYNVYSRIFYSRFSQTRTTVQSFAKCVRWKIFYYVFILFFLIIRLTVSYDLPCDCRSVQVRSEINSSDKMTGGGGCGAAGQLVKHNIHRFIIICTRWWFSYNEMVDFSTKIHVNIQIIKNK